MKHLITRRNLALLSVFSLCLFLSSAALTLTTSPDVYAACGSVDTSIVNCSEGDGNAVWTLLLIAVNVMAGLVGAAAIGGFIYAAILYTSAGDKSAQVTKAKETLANVVIGLVLFALMWAFMQFLIPGGVFKEYTAPVVKNAPTDRPDCNCDENGNPIAGGGGAGGGVQGPITPAAINIKNFRDASVSTGNKVLKPGVLYRSTELDLKKQSKIDKLSQLLSGGLILDLRRDVGTVRPKDATFPGVGYKNIAIDGKFETSGFVDEGDMNAKFGQALKTLATTNTPVLIHCQSGKDRTGWLVALVMYIAKASDAQVKTEYAKSLDAFPPPAHQAYWIDSGVSKAKKNYGSMMDYIKKGLGLSADEIKSIRAKYKA